MTSSQPHQPALSTRELMERFPQILRFPLAAIYFEGRPMKPLSKLTPLAAVAASLASLTCCLAFGFLAALGSAGAAVWLTSLRPWLLGLSALLLIIGFCQLYIDGSRFPRASQRRPLPAGRSCRGCVDKLVD